MSIYLDRFIRGIKKEKTVKEETISEGEHKQEEISSWHDRTTGHEHVLTYHKEHHGITGKKVNDGYSHIVLTKGAGGVAHNEPLHVNNKKSRETGDHSAAEHAFLDNVKIISTKLRSAK